MMNRLQDLKARKAELADRMEAILAAQEAGERAPTAEEDAEYLDLEAKIKATTADIKSEDQRIERRRDLSDQRHAEAEALPAAVPPTHRRIEMVRDESEAPFASLGEQLQAIAWAGMNKGAQIDRRLVWAAATGAGEAVPSEGGFLVDKTFSLELVDMMHDMGQVISRCRRIPIGANSNGLKLPYIDETSRANGSRWGGVRAYWADEASTVTSSRPAFGRLELDLKKLMGIGYTTEELLQDSTALEAIMRQAFAEEMTFKAEDAIINGTGAGQPLGILNGGALVSIAKESGQVAATVVAANILNMHAAMPSRHRQNGVWLINQEIEPQLYTIALPSGSAPLVMLYRPPGSNDAAGVSSFGTLLGRPVIPVEYCAALGTVGDILFVSLGEYLVIEKGGVRADSSMHVRFLYDEMTFRWVYRLDGQPAWKTALTPFKGTATYSPFVALQTRS